MRDGRLDQGGVMGKWEKSSLQRSEIYFEVESIRFIGGIGVQCEKKRRITHGVKACCLENMENTVSVSCDEKAF